eukprot:10678628-Alexandrium_andersonii.AAC.1
MRARRGRRRESRAPGMGVGISSKQPKKSKAGSGSRSKIRKIGIDPRDRNVIVVEASLGPAGCFLDGKSTKAPGD